MYANTPGGVFDVQVLSGLHQTELLEPGNTRISGGFLLPDDATLEMRQRWPALTRRFKVRDRVLCKVYGSLC